LDNKDEKFKDNLNGLNKELKSILKSKSNHSNTISNIDNKDDLNSDNEVTIKLTPQMIDGNNSNLNENNIQNFENNNSTQNTNKFEKTPVDFKMNDKDDLNLNLNDLNENNSKKF